MILVCLICLKGHTNWDTLWWLLIVLPFLRMASLNCVPRIEIVFINLLPPVVHSASQAVSPTFLACVMNCCTNAGLYCRLHVCTCTCIHCTCSCVICTPSKNTWKKLWLLKPYSDRGRSMIWRSKLRQPFLLLFFLMIMQVL